MLTEQPFLPERFAASVAWLPPRNTDTESALLGVGHTLSKCNNVLSPPRDGQGLPKSTSPWDSTLATRKGLREISAPPFISSGDYAVLDDPRTAFGANTRCLRKYGAGGY